jgi:hypothetical protein
VRNVTQFRNPTFAETANAAPGTVFVERKSSGGYIASLGNVEYRSSDRVEHEAPRVHRRTMADYRVRLAALEQLLHETDPLW